MSDIKKTFKIFEGDVGSEAFADEYVKQLEADNARLKALCREWQELYLERAQREGEATDLEIKRNELEARLAGKMSEKKKRKYRIYEEAFTKKWQPIPGSYIITERAGRALEGKDEQG